MRDIKGKILNEIVQDEDHSFGLTEKFCEFCDPRKDQPVQQVFIAKSLYVIYSCQTCSTLYYYLQHKAVKFNPQDVTKAPDTQEEFIKYYMLALNEQWYKQLRLDVTEIRRGQWTTATELCAQQFHKEMRGHVPGYCIGQLNATNEQVPLNNKQLIVESLNKLKEAKIL